jgi:hypothetical protein
MLELVLILAVAAYVLVRLDARGPGDPAFRSGGSAADAIRRAALDPSPRLHIAGTEQAALARRGCVRGFGVDPDAVHDLRIYAHCGPLASFPPPLALLLHALHAESCVLGAEAAALLFRGRLLAADEALYFALVGTPPAPRVIAFVDRRHR